MRRWTGGSTGGQSAVLDQPPEAVHEVALVELQVSVEVPPEATLVGLAVSVTVGADAVTVTVADCGVPVPPDPVQASV